MLAELDHVFLCVSRAAPEADRLSAAGLTEGRPNHHPGQGTACRRFFFSNAYLELLWVESPAEAQSELARPLHLWERWSGRDGAACPFGIVLRPPFEGLESAPFAGSDYRPAYLPQPLSIHVGANAPALSEPLLVYVPVHRRPDSLPRQERQPLEHRAGVREVTALRIFGPWPEPYSPTMQAAKKCAVEFHRGTEYLAEIGFDAEKTGARIDLRPLIPLILCS